LLTFPAFESQAATANCMYCPIQQGSEYLAQRNLYRHVYGWVRLVFV
jgi:hypothetical protein